MEKLFSNIRIITVITLLFSAADTFAQQYIIGWVKSGEPQTACSFWGMTQLEVCQFYGFDNINYYGKCSHGSSSGGMGLSQCIMEHKIVVPRENSNPPLSCSGNPIDNITGAKIQYEVDIPAAGIGQVSVARIYNNANNVRGGHWYNNYAKRLTLLDEPDVDSIQISGSSHDTKTSACATGWTSIRASLTDSWAQGATSSWNDAAQICEIKKNGQVVKQLPIVPALPIMRAQKPAYIQLHRGDGSILNFYKKTDVMFSQGDGNGGVLRIVNANPLKWELTLPSGEIEIYEGGRLSSLIASNGMKQELFYDATTGFLTSVKDSTNRELVFTYTGNNIASVTVDGNKTTRYTYNSSGLISQVSRPDNTTRTYHYEDTRFPDALTGITDERNKRYATWAYDDQGRAISSEHAGGADKTLLSFNNNMSTTVTNALNKKTHYFYSYVAGALRVIRVEGEPTASCAGANQHYTYTPEGWLDSKTDWKGIKTQYQYNALGQETSRTDAFGTVDARTITTEWHPTLYLKTKITEAGKETTFNYDANGRLLSQSTQAISN